MAPSRAIALAVLRDYTPDRRKPCPGTNLCRLNPGQYRPGGAACAGFPGATIIRQGR